MTKRERKFIETVWAYYSEHGRHDLPWRRMHRGKYDAYRILVSEVMLQQTQVPRVRLKYAEFMRTFRTVRALSDAPLGEVLRVWQGLGYNRRAKMLHVSAKEVVAKYNGAYPRTYQALLELPGIGPYTAAAVMAFAYNEPSPLIETNVRTVYLHHFFADRTDVYDRELMPLIERTMDHERAREWYWALMDYGAQLKATLGNQNVRSRHYVKQARFAGSDRQLRGALLRALATGPQTEASLAAACSVFTKERVRQQLHNLMREGMIERTKRTYHLPV